MPYRRLPNSTPAVIRTLKAARDKYKATPTAADRAMGADLFAKLDDAAPTSFLNRFLKEVSDVDVAIAAQAPLTGLVAQKAEQLTIFVSHFHQVLDLGITRGTFAPGARGYYGRDVHATSIPDLSTYDTLREAAEKVVSGEAARAAAEAAPTYDNGATYDSGLHYDGTYVAMCLPTAAQVAAKLAEFNAARAQSESAMSNTNTQQEESAAMYPEAHALAVDICDTVEFFYRKDPDPASRRAKCTAWGVVYVYEDGTTEPPAAPALPTT